MDRNYFKAKLNHELIHRFIVDNYLKNRTIASDDISTIFKEIELYTNQSFKIHAFATGTDCCTWIIPPTWNVKEAWLKSSSGQIIASYDEHPLFVCPYSISVDKKFTKKELESSVYIKSDIPEAFYYNWRLAMDYRLRLKSFMISLPHNRFNALNDNELYHLKINVEINNNPMLVGEMNSKQNSTAKTVLLVANYCHPGQVNDSFSGLALFMELMKNLCARKTKFNYKLLVLSETIGSIAYIDRFHEEIKSTSIGMIFSEMVAWGEKWYVKSSRTGASYFDTIIANLFLTYPEFNPTDFNSVYGNDELIFDSVGVGVPSISIQKHPFREYHSSEDSPDKIDYNQMQIAYSYLNDFIFILENNAVYKLTHALPPWLTRFEIYSDPITSKEDYKLKFKLIYELIDGKRSVLEIANILEQPFIKIHELVLVLAKQNLAQIILSHVEG